MAKILEIPEFFVKGIGLIWKTLTSGHCINTEKFGKVCQDFVAKVKASRSINWYIFSPTLHKILYHSKGNSISKLT